MEMAMEDGNPAAAEKIRAVLDKVMNRPSSASLQFLTPGCQDRWSWSDALFMSPPVFVKLAAYTGDRRYLEFMDREYKLTCDYLFDREEGLFFSGASVGLLDRMCSVRELMEELTREWRALA